MRGEEYGGQERGYGTYKEKREKRSRRKKKKRRRVIYHKSTARLLTTTNAAFTEHRGLHAHASGLHMLSHFLSHFHFFRTFTHSPQTTTSILHPATVYKYLQTAKRGGNWTYNANHAPENANRLALPATAMYSTVERIRQ